MNCVKWSWGSWFHFATTDQWPPHSGSYPALVARGRHCTRSNRGGAIDPAPADVSRIFAPGNKRLKLSRWNVQTRESHAVFSRIVDKMQDAGRMQAEERTKGTRLHNRHNTSADERDLLSRGPLGTVVDGPVNEAHRRQPEDHFRPPRPAPPPCCRWKEFSLLDESSYSVQFLTPQRHVKF